MDVKINDSCIGCGACESICDSVFKVEDVAKVQAAGIAGHEDCVKEAADAWRCAELSENNKLIQAIG